MISLLSRRLGPLRNADGDALLAFDPQELTSLEVILVILVFVGRQILHLLGLASQFRVNNHDKYELPELSVSMPFDLTEGDLRQYAVALEEPTVQSGDLDRRDLKALLDSPAQTCLLLSALTEPAMLLLLAHHKSPIRPLGAVNVKNMFEVLRPDMCTAESLIKTKTGVVARLVRQTRKVKRGLEIDVVVEIVSYEEDPLVIYRQVFTMLQFMRFRTKPDVLASRTESLDIAELRARGNPATFTMSMNSPTTWAAVCKDYNPIHISRLAANLFGFKSTIAHGNHALAIALEQFERSNEFTFHSKDKPFSMKVQFRKPIVLPATLGALAVQDEEDRCDFYVEQKSKICVSASLHRSEGR
ncbi:hypothetical protein PMZ80_006693 [Knufia obscura]|uniref:MaoC-like domain-containing protein n=1 Tax=Knufia obscura TaxID=1635080 RepID=A0ABR0RLC3_9EURO|nr:hypothetical protein PMZ80_006693 [Knufia obscura]